ncbi:Cell division protein DedD (protein involved in septation) [Desulfacinum hydrothermale DSM 13146]|uniref:Cell division protein DedD (Protein involved in septation) n=1 Tax=Desulfacinum hydrothermale DSM 13146 TaxID=1121390 RepID=A0A1W1X932_9BACT|nr:SPOR domain-containing protein [Desulfacinum hydrothermale]SMC20482.1 Cell division protein DedD (protein involved in septation) [Desulfacinum hydrothermale DSM 13146]
MARNKAQASKRGTQRDRPRVRLSLQLTLGQCVVCALVFLVCLAWIFVAGILVGRTSSPQGADVSWMPPPLAHLLGLDRPPPAPDPHAADTWLPPEKILASLQFEKTLPQETNKAPRVSPGPSAQPAPAQKDGSSALTQGQANGTPAPESSEGTYALMVASMRHRENALSMADRLKKEGYQPQVERVSMGDQDVWYRVTLGSFASRQEALEFAARFNREQNLEALVIQKEAPSGESP